ncbi:MAG TPA: hypothetical protein VGM10_19470 [Actinocrinis sp.]
MAETRIGVGEPGAKDVEQHRVEERGDNGGVAGEWLFELVAEQAECGVEHAPIAGLGRQEDDGGQLVEQWVPTAAVEEITAAEQDRRVGVECRARQGGRGF